VSDPQQPERAIGDGDVVVIRYTLTEADSGEVLDRSGDATPFAYLHGHGNIVPGLEAALAGRSVGHAFDLTLEPADAYGERKGPGPQPVPRREFRKDVHLAPGMRFKAKGSSGEEVPLWVIKVAGSRVYVDREHPLVGKRLRFVGEVLSVRDSDEHERAHGHAHGPDGHAHG
jgi:FKBP-type peptidyl-prolyl cis-trans isomerase SlyD